MYVGRNDTVPGCIGISGHAGVGHVHSHNGFVQDDSAGFSIVVELMRRAYPVNTTIMSVTVDTGEGLITVTTVGGGTGRALARRGITPHEASLAQYAIGSDAVYSQSLAYKTFGRIYGQGALEVPVAFQTACCLAVMNTFTQAYPQQIVSGVEDMPGKIGGYIGARVMIDDIPVSLLGLVNANAGGIGPDEDLEGNIMLGDKGRVMKELSLDRIPTIVLESKAYVPALCSGVAYDRMWVRINKDIDNTHVYNALLHGVAESGVKALCSDTAYPRGKGEMAEATRNLGLKIAALGEALAKAELSSRKVAIVAELNRIVSEDAGGVTFMSNHMHDQVAGGGTLPGTSAVLSMLVSEAYIKERKIPEFSAQDTEIYLKVLSHALPELLRNIDAANTQLYERFSFDEAAFADNYAVE